MQRPCNGELVVANPPKSGELDEEPFPARAHQELAPLPCGHDRRPRLFVRIMQVSPRAAGNVLRPFIEGTPCAFPPAFDHPRPALAEIAALPLHAIPPAAALGSRCGTRAPRMTRHE